MTSVSREVLIDIDADVAWTLLRRFDGAAVLFEGAVSLVEIDGDVRRVTFPSGMIAVERLIAVDDDARRFVYAVESEPFAHHNASMQVVPTTEGACRFLWVSDFLPDEVAAGVVPLIDEGCRVVKTNLERLAVIAGNPGG